MKTNKTFRHGSGCFTCQECKKRTRDVNGQNGQLGLCELCQTKGECGNSLSDNSYGYKGDCWKTFAECKTVAECNALLEKLLEEYPA